MTTYRQLQSELKAFRDKGYVLQVKLNAKTSDLVAELDRIHAIESELDRPIPSGPSCDIPRDQSRHSSDTPVAETVTVTDSQRFTIAKCAQVGVTADAALAPALAPAPGDQSRHSSDTSVAETVTVTDSQRFTTAKCARIGLALHDIVHRQRSRSAINEALNVGGRYSPRLKSRVSLAFRELRRIGLAA